MSANTNGSRVDEDGLFTNEEHAVLAKWFGQPAPAAAAHVKLNAALKKLGFDQSCRPYTKAAAAVAYILLTAILEHLPNWTSWRDDELIEGRTLPDSQQRTRGSASLEPIKLFTINWATSGPGFDWPVSYHYVWVPFYDRYVVTASADGPDAFGYADFALGHLGEADDLKRSVAEIIKRDWIMQRKRCGQREWEHLIETRVFDADDVDAIRRQVWPGDRERRDKLWQEEMDFYRRIGGGPITVVRGSRERR